jgi:hypothetical protein
MCSPDFKLENKCPLCRRLYERTESTQYAKYCKNYENNVADRVEQQINKLLSRNPDFALPIAYVGSMVSKDELNVQVSAINDMFAGKMSYAEMRMLAG